MAIHLTGACWPRRVGAGPRTGRGRRCRWDQQAGCTRAAAGKKLRVGGGGIMLGQLEQELGKGLETESGKVRS